MEKEKILYDSNEAAKKINVSGWVSSDGHFYGDDEHLARWAGCTHQICECGNEHNKSRTMCNACWEKELDKRYNEKPFKVWDKIEPLTIHREEIWFFNENELRDYIVDNSINFEDLQLVICEPNYAREIDYDDFNCDILPEDTYLHEVFPELSEAIESVNEIIRKNEVALSWSGGRYRTKYEACKV